MEKKTQDNDESSFPISAPPPKKGGKGAAKFFFLQLSVFLLLEREGTLSNGKITLLK